MATASQAPDDGQVQFPSIPGQTPTHATLPSTANPRAGPGYTGPPLSALFAPSGKPMVELARGRFAPAPQPGPVPPQPGPVSPLMQFISTIRAQNATQQGPAMTVQDPNDLRGQPLDAQNAAMLKAGGFAAPDPGPTRDAAKQYQDPLGVSMMAALHSISAAAAGAIHEPQNHSEDEFVKAAGSIPFGQLKQIIAMRHQWTPQEMAQQAYLRELQKPAAERASPDLMRAYAMMGLGQNFLYSPGAIATTNFPGAPVPGTPSTDPPVK